MKKIKKLYILSSVFLLGLTSCNDWLDVQPKTELKQEDLLKDVQGFEEALTGVYVSMTEAATYGRELTVGMLSVMGSDYSVENSGQVAKNNLPMVERFDYESTQLKSLTAGVWKSQFHSIALVNNILKQIDDKRGLFSELAFNRIKGEALGLRAFLHFDLMRMYAPSYVHKDENSYLPYVTKFGRESTPLATMNTYTDLLLNDISDAESLLKDDVIIGDELIISSQGYTNDRKIRMNRVAVKGLKSRIMLYLGNKEEAYKLAKEVIDAREIKLRAQTYEINLDRSLHGEHLFALYSDKFEERILNLVTPGEGQASSAPYYFTNSDKLSITIFEKEDDDIRFKAPATQEYKGYRTSHKFLYRDLDPSIKGARRYFIPLIKLSEMYYIAAETAPTKEEAFDLLNAVAENRGLLPIPSTADLEGELFKEYRKEFYIEGQLFFYYKRLAKSRITDSPAGEMSKDSYIFPMPEDEKIYGGRN